MNIKQVIAIAALVAAPAVLVGLSANAAANSDTGFVESNLDTKPVKAIDKEFGKGTIKLKNKKTGKILKKIKAFTGGGVDARLANIGTDGEQKGVLAMQEQKGKFLKVYSRDGQLLARRKVSSSKRHHEYTSGKMVKGDDENYIAVARKTGQEQVLLFVYTYDEDDREVDRVTSKTVTGLAATKIDDGFSLQIKKRKIKIKDENGKTIESLKLSGKTLE